MSDSSVTSISSDVSNGQNIIATVLRVIAWIAFAGGVIAGFVIGTVPEFPDYPDLGSILSFTVALPYWVAAIVTLAFLLGFAEIISLLQKIVNKNYNIKKS